MGQDPDAIRREIEQTRERMGDTVEAIGYKADVPARTKEKVSDTFSDMKDRIGGTATAVADRVGGTATAVNEATPNPADVKHAAKRGVSMAQENPLGLAIGSVAVGFLAGMLIPTTRVEGEKIGPMAGELREQAMQTGQEALEHGKQLAQEVASTVQDHAQQAKEDVKQTAQQAAQEHGEQLKQSAQESAQQIREQAPSS
jgi:gas vesicle protein